VQFWTYFYVTASILATVAFRDWWRHGHRLSRPLAVVLILMLVSSVIDKPLDTAARKCVIALWPHTSGLQQQRKLRSLGTPEACMGARGMAIVTSRPHRRPRDAVIATRQQAEYRATMTTRTGPVAAISITRRSPEVADRIVVLVRNWGSQTVRSLNR
jgi:hypothetical protein